MKGEKIILAAGGSGGHMFPAEALAEELILRGYKPILVTDNRGSLYKGLLSRIERYTVPSGSLSNSGFGGKINGLVMNFFGFLRAKVLLSGLAPCAVVGFGGYPSFPTMLAATRLGTPAAIHEQNAVLGRVNQLLAKRVKLIALSYDRTKLVPSNTLDRCVVTGNPLRSSIIENKTIYQPPSENGEIDLVVLGGSQGARILSDIIPKALSALPDDIRRRIRVVQQCRSEDIERVKSGYADSSINSEISFFIDNIAERLAKAHLVISRAGASTIAELAAIGRPSVLIPYAHARDNHQWLNAKILKDAGGAWVISEEEFTPEELIKRLIFLFSSPRCLSKAAAAAGLLGKNDATTKLADLVENLFHNVNFQKVMS